MQVSKYALYSYNINEAYFFASRTQRDAYFADSVIPVQTRCAIATGGDVNADPASAIWEVDEYNGSNWATLDLNQNFALIVTDDGIKALTDASKGQYKLELSRILIKQTKIPNGVQVATWKLVDNFVGSGGYGDICLDSKNVANSTFSLENNLSYRTNMLNGGIQFTLQLGMDCIGQYSTEYSSTPNVYPTLSSYNVSAIGLCVASQNIDNYGEDILFAVANLPASVAKVASTPDQVGNDLKFYLNTALSNFGNVVNLTPIVDSVSSVPEVLTENDLTTMYDGVNSPYNLYLVDNLASTNVPALAVRRGNPTSTDDPIHWTYFTPNDDNVYVDDEHIDKNTLKNYMIAAYNNTIGKYVPADSNNQDLSPVGLYNQNNIIYAGRIINSNTDYTYNFTVNNSRAHDYEVGDELQVTKDGITFLLRVTSVGINGENTGVPLTWVISPTSGNTRVEGSNLTLTYKEGEEGFGSNLTLSITSVDQTSNVTWNFPSGWINRPLYVDYNHTGETTTKWNKYCNDIGIPTTSNKNRVGLLTPLPNGTYEMFAGWCINSNTVKISTDMDTQATETRYGTTRYATDTEVKTLDVNAKNVTSVTPNTLKSNYLQITTGSGIGDTVDTPIQVDTYVKFNKTIVGKGATGTVDENVSFYGLAYRAWWEDLAEFYKSDKLYPAGTLICIGSGLAEITEAINECNGIISTKPGYELGKKEDSFDLPVALIGKVPVLFDGKCVPNFGDKVYLSRLVPGRASNVPFGKCLGKVIDKHEHLDQSNTVMCSVRIEF